MCESAKGDTEHSGEGDRPLEGVVVVGGALRLGDRGTGAPSERHDGRHCRRIALALIFASVLVLFVGLASPAALGVVAALAVVGLVGVWIS